MPTKTTIRSKVLVRVAEPNEGPLIHSLFTESGKWEIDCLDWTADIGPYWLIAEYDGVPTGCIMVRPGRPIGSLELLCIPKLFAHRVKAQVAKALLVTGLHALKRAGAQVASGILHDGLESYARLLQRRGAVPWFVGTAYLRRL